MLYGQTVGIPTESTNDMMTGNMRMSCDDIL